MVYLIVEYDQTKEENKQISVMGITNHLNKPFYVKNTDLEVTSVSFSNDENRKFDISQTMKGGKKRKKRFLKKTRKKNITKNKV